MKIKKEILLILAVMILAFALRSYHINHPYLDHHSWKQTEIAEEALNFYEVEYNIFHPLVTAFTTNKKGEYIDVYNVKEGLHYIEEVFSIVPFITATLYFIFGVHPWVGRLAAILFSIFTIPFLYRLVKLHLNREIALYSIILFAIFPLNVFFGRALQEEPAMVFFIVSGLYYISRWCRIEKDNNESKENIKEGAENIEDCGGQWRDFILGGILVSLAILVKIPSLYLGLPIMYLVYTKYKWNLFRQWKVWLLAALIILPPLSYYSYTQFIIYPMSKVSIIFGNTPELKHILSGQFSELYFLHDYYYINMYKHIIGVVLTPVGLVLMLLGVFIKNDSAYNTHNTHDNAKNENYFFHFWLLAVIISFFIMAQQTEIHTYYKMSLIPVASVFAAIAIHRISNIKFKLDARHFSIGKFAYIMPLLILLLGIFHYLPPLYQENVLVQAAANDIKQISQRNDLIISVLYGDDPEVLYNADRKGWALGSGSVKEELIEKLRKRGAKYLVHLALWDYDKYPESFKYLTENYNFINRQYYLLFDLREKKNKTNAAGAIQSAQAAQASKTNENVAEEGNKAAKEME